jgi:hypothetical protein
VHDVRGNLAPQARSFEHIRLVDGDDLLAPLHGKPACDARDSLDFAGRIAAEIGGQRRGAGFGSEVDAAGELAHEHQVHAVENLRLEHRCVAQRWMQLDRPEVGVDTELAPQAQQTLFGAYRRRRAPFWATNGT